MLQLDFTHCCPFSSTLQHVEQLEELSLGGVKAFPPHPSLHTGRAGRRGWQQLSHAVLLAFFQEFNIPMHPHWKEKPGVVWVVQGSDSLYFQPWELSLF